jgi:hypothetical protein
LRHLVIKRGDSKTGSTCRYDVRSTFFFAVFSNLNPFISGLSVRCSLRHLIQQHVKLFILRSEPVEVIRKAAIAGKLNLLKTDDFSADVMLGAGIWSG